MKEIGDISGMMVAVMIGAGLYRVASGTEWSWVPVIGGWLSCVYLYAAWHRTKR